MRLIDVDKLHYKKVYIRHEYDENSTIVVFAKEIDKAEEVKAVPIEWIKEYASEKSFNDEMDCYWHIWEEDVLKMIEDWEKENEQSSISN